MTDAVATGRYASLRAHWLARALLAAALLTAAGTVLMGSLLFDPGSRILGGFNDAALGIRSYDLIDQAGETPFTYERDELNGAPEGVPAVRAIQYAAPVQPAVIWLLKGPLGLIGAMNAFLLSGLLLTGVAMFLLLDRFRFGFLPSLLGAYLVTFNPWMYERVFSGHAAFMHGWVLILLFFTLFRLRRDRTLPNAALAGLAYGLCFLMASYTGLLATALVAAFAVVDIVASRDWPERLWTATLLLVISCVLVVFLLPGLVALAIDRDVVSGTLTRTEHQIERLSASPVNYLLPSPRHPLLGDLADRVRPDDLFNEKVVFLGYSTLVLALLAVVHLVSRRRRSDVPTEERRLLWLAAAAGGIGLVLSFGRKLSFGPVDIPMPGYVVTEVTTYYRVYGRLGFVVAIAAAILAAWMLARLGRRRHGTVIALALFALVVFETLPSRATALAVDTPPAHDAWLATQPRGIVAHYPMMTDRIPAEKLVAREMYYQRFTGLPHFELYSTQRVKTREDAIRLLARYVTGRGTPGILAAEGVKYVVVHDDVYREQGEPSPRLGPQFRFLRGFGDVRIYELRAKPANLDRVLEDRADEVGALWDLTPVKARLDGGFYGGERYLDYTGSWRWMNQDGGLRFTNDAEGPVRVRLSGLAFANRELRQVELRDEQGRTVAKALVDTFLAPLRLGPFQLPPGTSRYSLVASPGPTPLSGTDLRETTVYLSPLRVAQFADYSSSLRER
jgi:hypothetical protein